MKNSINGELESFFLDSRPILTDPFLNLREKVTVQIKKQSVSRALAEAALNLESLLRTWWCPYLWTLKKGSSCCVSYMTIPGVTLLYSKLHNLISDLMWNKTFKCMKTMKVSYYSIIWHITSKVEAYFIIHTIDLVVRESEWIKCALHHREKKDRWMEKLEPTFRQIIGSAKEKLITQTLIPLYTEEFLFPCIKVICL